MTLNATPSAGHSLAAMPRRLRVLLVVIACACWSASAAAADGPLVVVVEETDAALDAERLRAAVAEELGVEVVDAERAGARGRLAVRVSGDRATLSYRGEAGSELIRHVELPSDPERRIEVIALLAGNLARDEARALADELGIRPDPAPATEAGPEPSEPREPERPPAPKPQPKGTADAVATPKPAGPRSARLLNLSLYHPIALVPDSRQHRITIELGLAYSHVGALGALGLNALHLRSDGDTDGLAIAGLWMHTAGDTHGVSVSGLYGRGAGRLDGVEAGGLALWRSGAVRGAQLSGLANLAGPVAGVQATGGLNLATGELRGAQLASVNLVTEGASGAQVGGVNVAGSLDGVQLGVVNVGGHVNGAMVGVVNVADRVDGLPLGVVNVIAEGRTQAVAWSDTIADGNVGVKYLNGPVYTLLGAGFELGDQTLAPAFALGAQLPIVEPTYAQVDLMYRYVTNWPDTPHQGSHAAVARVGLGWQIAKPVGLVLGGGLHYSEPAPATPEFEPYGYAALELF